MPSWLLYSFYLASDRSAYFLHLRVAHCRALTLMLTAPWLAVVYKEAFHFGRIENVSVGIQIGSCVENSH